MKVPINPKVLLWAVNEAGMGTSDVAKYLGVPLGDLQAWLTGDEQPQVSHFRRLSALLKRPTATFLLPAPPKSAIPQVQFRHPPGREDRPLNPRERLALREAGRLQKALSWVTRELDQDRLRIPKFTTTGDPESAAEAVRKLVGVTVPQQTKWKNEFAAFSGWRSALERLGVVVMALPMGAEASRGFSAFDERVPVIAVNTHWRSSARIYTLFHEMGHLVSRTSSVCEELVGYRHRDGGDAVERWCESFAAAFLIPWQDLDWHLRYKTEWVPGTQVQDLTIPGIIARRYRVSLRAALLRLINKGVAPWSLYKSIPKAAESKSGGGGGTGRIRPQIRFDEYGGRTAKVLIQGLHSDVLSRDDVLGYLDIGDGELGYYETAALSQ